MQRDTHHKTTAPSPAAPLPHDFEQRLIRLEAECKHMVTHKDISDLQGKMATKKDTDQIWAEIRKLQAGIRDIRAEMATKKDIEQFREATEKDIEQFREATEKDTDQIREHMVTHKDIVHLLYWIVGTGASLMVVILGAFFTFL